LLGIISLLSVDPSIVDKHMTLKTDDAVPNISPGKQLLLDILDSQHPLHSMVFPQAEKSESSAEKIQYHTQEQNDGTGTFRSSTFAKAFKYRASVGSMNNEAGVVVASIEQLLANLVMHYSQMPILLMQQNKDLSPLLRLIKATHIKEVNSLAYKVIDDEFTRSKLRLFSLNHDNKNPLAINKLVNTLKKSKKHLSPIMTALALFNLHAALSEYQQWQYQSEAERIAKLSNSLSTTIYIILTAFQKNRGLQQ